MKARCFVWLGALFSYLVSRLVYRSGGCKTKVTEGRGGVRVDFRAEAREEVAGGWF